MAAIFTAADISGLSTQVSTVLIALVGVSLLFVGYRYLKRSGIKA
jgi:membrane protein implicated in regulation of membrane protease activity